MVLTASSIRKRTDREGKIRDTAKPVQNLRETG
jgi:hypothetical protein